MAFYTGVVENFLQGDGFFTLRFGSVGGHRKERWKIIYVEADDEQQAEAALSGFYRSGLHDGLQGPFKVSAEELDAGELETNRLHYHKISLQFADEHLPDALSRPVS
jgi:hypothetical protein